MLRYMQLTMPDPTDPDDADKSRYIVTPQAKLLCETIERARAGYRKRIAISIGPQMGKSDVLSRKGPAWLSGNDPTAHMILGSYNQDFANDFGFAVRNIIQSNAHRQVFPNYALMRGGEGQDHLVTAEGGQLAFVGIGGSGSGKPADYFFVDDPYRNEEDANSATYREKVWKWFNGVVMARCHDGTVVIVVHTRWHQDDLIGRLCDPDHPERNGLYEGIADYWTYLNLPAVVDEPQLAEALGLTLEVPTDPRVIKQFGNKPMSALWPGRKSLPLMAEAKQSDTRIFTSLYMGKPSPDEGTYFKSDYLVEYDRRDLPSNLRYYGASDHAVTAKQRRDYNCVGCVGIDLDENIWVLPDIAWRRGETDTTVEEMIAQFKAHSPQYWWMEDELISKSFGPFLRKRMRAERTYTVLDPVRPAVDLEARARSVQGLMALQQIRFPRFAPWWQNAKSQMLNFPSATHNDFVAWLSLIGLGITKVLKPSRPKLVETGPPTGSIQWILKSADERARKEKREKSREGW